MHISPLILLPLLVAADQAPFLEQAAGWFNKAKAYVSSAAPSIPIPEFPNPIDAGASKVAASVVEKINIRNWQRKLAPKADTDEEWLILLTGGNKTCYGKCGPINTVWNKSVPLLAALSVPAGSPRLKLGLLDCEKDEVLCTAWASGVPVIYHLLITAQASTSSSSGTSPLTPLHIIPLNLTTTEVSDIVALPSASKSRYLEFDEYTGILHPFDGVVAKFGLLQPFGYFMWALGSMPGWVMMLGISFVSRQIMSKRMARTGGIPEVPAAGAAQGGQPAPRVAPATGSQPRAGVGSASEKRK